MTSKLAGIVFLVATASAGYCGPITMDQWYTTQWSGGVGSSLQLAGVSTTDTTGLAAPPWTFTGPAFLEVTDMYTDGDQFDVFDNGVLLGATSTPMDDGKYCGANPQVCSTGGSWSAGGFQLGDGNHAVTITLTAEADGFSSGLGAFEVDAQFVPEPATFGLMALGCAGLLLRRARKNSSRG